MELDRDKLRRDIQRLYADNHAALGREGALRLLDRGRKWDLAPTLNAGGVLVFPHAGVADCGHQTAAVVHACLDCGADRVLVISVLHALTDEMEAARVRVAQGGDLEAEPLRNELGANFLVVTPGIRPGLNRDVEKDDQKRVATAQQAIINGADHVVIGRPISTSPDPLYTVQTIQEEIARGVAEL